MSDNNRPIPPCPEGIKYMIRPGDTFFAISRRFGISLDDLLEANPGVDPDDLRVGQQLCVPQDVLPMQCQPGSSIYSIRDGDNFFSIAQRFGISVQTLIHANPGVDPGSLLIGQQLCVPTGPQPVGCPTGTFNYSVRAGDTFFILAVRFNTTIDAIRQANPQVNLRSLRIGQVLCIPGQVASGPGSSGS